MPLPAPVLVTDNELDLLCQWLSQQTYIYYPVATDFILDLYNTGCRPMELLTQGLWNYVSSTDIELTPLKGNNTRTFTEAELSNGLVYAIQNDIRPYNALSLRQLTSVMKKIITWFKLETADKSAIDYAFRYNKVKQLHNAGNSDATIQTIFGWIEPAMPASYYSQDLFIVGNFPPDINGLIIDYDGTFVIDDSGNYIN